MKIKMNKKGLQRTYHCLLTMFWKTFVVVYQNLNLIRVNETLKSKKLKYLLQEKVHIYNH